MAQRVLIMAMQSGLAMSCGKFPPTSTPISLYLNSWLDIADFRAVSGSIRLGRLTRGQHAGREQGTDFPHHFLHLTQTAW